MIVRFLVILLAVAALAGGCARTTHSSHGFSDSLNRPYLLDSGDNVRITVFGQDSLTRAYSVDASGVIAFPLIGNVPARGHTLDQLERNIASRLAQGYLRSPNVAAEIVTYRPFFILGEVRNPGQYPFVAGMTVRTAVAIAGGFTPRAAKRKVAISRQIRGQVVHGSVALEHPIRPGDTINVDERFF